MAKEINRRTVVKGAAWALPVIAAACAIPLATASVITVPTKGRPTACRRTEGVKNVYTVDYEFGTSEQVHNGTVKSDPVLRVLCPKGNES